MRHRRMISWMLTLAAAAVLGIWASQALRPEPAGLPDGPSAGIARFLSDDQGELIPDAEDRLREQIETLSRGMAASKAALHPAPGPGLPSPGDGGPSAFAPDIRVEETASGRETAPRAEGLASTQEPRSEGDASGREAAGRLPFRRIGWAVLLGGLVVMAAPAVYLRARRRRAHRAPASRLSPEAEAVACRETRPEAEAASGTERLPSVTPSIEPPPRRPKRRRQPGPTRPGADLPRAETPVSRAEFADGMRGMQESILEVVRLVEEMQQRPEGGGETVSLPEPMVEPARTEPAAQAAGGEEPKEEQRGPWADRDLSLPVPSTPDGRNLSTIRRAVLRLAQEGWQGDRIADRLHLGRGDVGLILKTRKPEGKAASRLDSEIHRN